MTTPGKLFLDCESAFADANIPWVMEYIENDDSVRALAALSIEQFAQLLPTNRKVHTAKIIRIAREAIEKTEAIDILPAALPSKNETVVVFIVTSSKFPFAEDGSVSLDKVIIPPRTHILSLRGGCLFDEDFDMS